jgi:hypothetical protein
VHVPWVLDLLLKDTHYRSQFETKTSSGTNDNKMRDHWEASLFGNAYLQGGVTPFDKCKYGVMNTTGDPGGVGVASSYGDSYLVLRPEVRWRATFTNSDSGAMVANRAGVGSSHSGGGGGDPATFSLIRTLPPPPSKKKRAAMYSHSPPPIASLSYPLGTCDHYAHILAQYTDAELRSVVEVACGSSQMAGSSSSSTSTYKEVQVHGPIDLARDIDSLVLNKKHRGNAEALALAVEFRDMFGVPFIVL